MQEPYSEFESLLRPIDRKATINRASHYLEADYPALKRIANRILVTDDGIKSPAISDMPKGSGSGNRVEDRILNDIVAKQKDVKQVSLAQRAVAATEQTINNLGHDSKTILTKLFMEQQSDVQVYMDCCFSESSYFHNYKPQALLEFADAFGMIVYK